MQNNGLHQLIFTPMFLKVKRSDFFELKQEQKIAVNCLLEGRDVFAVMPTGFGKSFSFQLFSTAIEQKKISEGLYPNSVILVICPLISLIEDQIKEGQSLGLTTNSLHKFLILRLHGRQTRSDKLGDLINVAQMFSYIEAKTSPRLPSRFEATYKFCVDIRPDFPVPCLTLKEHLHIRQQSFA